MTHSDEDNMPSKQVTIQGVMTWEGSEEGGGVPTHPIYYPPGIWGGSGSLPPFPAHPIAPGGGTGIWGPGSPMPTPPIHLPPTGQPPGIWGGGPFPTPPIHLPPTGGGSTEPDPEDKFFILKWNPKFGWMVIPVPKPEPVPPTEGGEAEPKFGR